MEDVVRSPEPLLPAHIAWGCPAIPWPSEKTASLLAKLGPHAKGCGEWGDPQPFPCSHPHPLPRQDGIEGPSGKQTEERRWTEPDVGKSPVSAQSPRRGPQSTGPAPKGRAPGSLAVLHSHWEQPGHPPLTRTNNQNTETPVPRRKGPGTALRRFSREPGKGCSFGSSSNVTGNSRT